LGGVYFQQQNFAVDKKIIKEFTQKVNIEDLKIEIARQAMSISNARFEYKDQELVDFINKKGNVISLPQRQNELLS
jgi:hypothetical protein